MLVSTSKLDFTRLVKAMDELAPALGEEMVVQVGFTRYRPKNAARVVEFLDLPSYDDHVRRASVVVAQGGIGGILTCLQYGTPMIVVPRLPEHGELEDDHQREIRRIVEELGIGSLVQYVEDVKDLPDAIRRAREGKAGFERRRDLPQRLRGYLDTLRR